MREKALIGAGGFADEIKSYMGDMVSFVDDKYFTGQQNVRPLSEFDPDKYEVLVAIGNPTARRNVCLLLPKNTKFFTYIHPTAFVPDSCKIGKGSIICPMCILTVNIHIGDHAQLNIGTTVGHGAVIGDYFTTAPRASVSGDCNIGDEVYIGTGAAIREKINITNRVTIGLSSGVVKDIDESGVYGGVPVKKIK